MTIYSAPIGRDLYALISQDTQLKRISGTNGGEFAGPCPFCGGGRDRLRVWPSASKPGWWCRQCGKGGDAIQYLREQGYSYADACQALGVEGVMPRTEHKATPQAPEVCEPPSRAWRTAGAGFVLWAIGQMADAARTYLHGRGLADKTIASAQLGYNPTTREVSRSKWGLAPDAEYGDRFWLPAGIVIPTHIDGSLWKIQIRRDDAREGQDRYKTVPGSANALYGADGVRVRHPAVLVEGPFDALAVSQEAGNLCAVCASGTSGARRVRWLGRLALASEVLICFDADAAGDHAADYWTKALPNARRWRPYYSDPAQMLEDGQDVRGWIMAGLRGDKPTLNDFSVDIVTRANAPDVWIYRLWDDRADRVIGEYTTEEAAHMAARAQTELDALGVPV